MTSRIFRTSVLKRTALAENTPCLGAAILRHGVRFSNLCTKPKSLFKTGGATLCVRQSVAHSFKANISSNKFYIARELFEMPHKSFDLKIKDEYRAKMASMLIELAAPIRHGDNVKSRIGRAYDFIAKTIKKLEIETGERLCQIDHGRIRSLWYEIGLATPYEMDMARKAVSLKCETMPPENKISELRSELERIAHQISALEASPTGTVVPFRQKTSLVGRGTKNEQNHRTAERRQ